MKIVFKRLKDDSPEGKRRSIEGLVKRAKIKDQAAKKILESPGIVLKKNLSEEDAKIYASILMEIGIVCSVVKETVQDLSPALRPKPSEAKTAEKEADNNTSKHILKKFNRTELAKIVKLIIAFLIAIYLIFFIPPFKPRLETRIYVFILSILGIPILKGIIRHRPNLYLISILLAFIIGQLFMDYLPIFVASEGRYRTLSKEERASIGQSVEEARKLNMEIRMLRLQGRYQEAISAAKRALAILEKAPGAEPKHFAYVSDNLGVVYYSLGEYTKAELLYKRALAIREKIPGPEHSDVSVSLNNLAALYTDLGDYAKAEPLYKRALAIREKSPGPEQKHLTASLNNLAALYHALGEYTKAEPLYKRALAISSKTSYRLYGGDLYSPDSLAALRSAERRIKAGFRGGYAQRYLVERKQFEAFSIALLGNLAQLYLEEGRIDEAFRISMKQGELEGLGACYLAKGDYRMAAREFQKSLKYTEKGRKKFLITDHIGLGLSYEGMGDLGKAKRHFKKAIDLIEVQWQTLGLFAKKNFLAGRVGCSFSRLDAYEGVVRVIINEKKKGYQREALLYAERVKSRTLLEILAAKAARGVGSKDREVLVKDRQFQQEIFMQRKRLSKLQELGPRAAEEEKDRAEQDLNKTLQEYERFINEVKRQDSELASLITVEATPVEKTQSLLDPYTTILEYFTTKGKTYAWLITKNEIELHELNLGKNTILTMVNDLLLPNISNRSRRPEPIITLSTSGPQAEETSSHERDKNRQLFLKSTRDFYRSLLGPVEEAIRTDRLIIVPHGALHKVPFAALNDGKQFMVDKYAVSVVPSLKVIEYVVKKRTPNQGKFLAFANPETHYIPLGFAEIEVNNISRLFSKKEIYFKREATESRAKERSNSPDIIHFACHGEFNDKQPMQSGLLLSKDADNDGYLQVHEIFGLDLGNANLVVLSACETALSKIYGGDDLVGLSRGFIYAGTPSILATLWDVDDRSTSILMKEFYENWYKKGMNKSEALRKAQVVLKSMPLYSHPYYWAAFIMIGDWM